MENQKQLPELKSKQLNTVSPLLMQNPIEKKISELKIGVPAEGKDLTEALKNAYVISSCRHEITTEEAIELKDTYYLKYKGKLTANEFVFAFKLHQAGELGERVQHYQTFSIEFMTTILDRYLAKRKAHDENVMLETQKQAEKEAELKRKSEVIKLSNAILDEIALNFDESTSSGILTHTVPFKEKFKVFLELVEVDVTEDEIRDLNLQSISLLIQKKSARLKEVAYRVKGTERVDGEKIELMREIECLKLGRWSDKVENELKTIFKMELYKFKLSLLGKEFKSHVVSQKVK